METPASNDSVDLPIDRAVRIVGGLSVLAKLVGVSAPTVHEWTTDKRQVPARRCKAIELATSGQVTVQQLRPADWQDYWPELAQAPAIHAPVASNSVAHGA